MEGHPESSQKTAGVEELSSFESGLWHPWEAWTEQVSYGFQTCRHTTWWTIQKSCFTMFDVSCEGQSWYWYSRCVLCCSQKPKSRVAVVTVVLCYLDVNRFSDTSDTNENNNDRCGGWFWSQPKNPMSGIAVQVWEEISSYLNFRQLVFLWPVCRCEKASKLKTRTQNHHRNCSPSNACIVVGRSIKYGIRSGRFPSGSYLLCLWDVELPCQVSRISSQNWNSPFST